MVFMMPGMVERSSGGRRGSAKSDLSVVRWGLLMLTFMS